MYKEYRDVTLNGAVEQVPSSSQPWYYFGSLSSAPVRSILCYHFAQHECCSKQFCAGLLCANVS